MNAAEHFPDVTPIVLFAYARPTHLSRALACLRENGVPLIYAFADGPKDYSAVDGAEETRALLRRVDWCEMRLVERAENFGLGRNVLEGVSEVAERFASFIVWEDDLICVPGTYAWMCAALQQYANDREVMSITAWTHPRVTPPRLDGQPYLDARAECWVWGTWKRAWQGMVEENALQKLEKCESRGLASNAYGDDLPIMAKSEQIQNIWAVRWLYHHLQHGGLCLRPPWSMVEHIGFDVAATNAASASSWANPGLKTAPAIPSRWPDSLEHPRCRALWQATRGYSLRSLWWRLRAKLMSA
jgi:hypothetical protein